MTSQTETPDIVERLLMHGGKADIEDVLADCREAAAEIEGLRSELADAQQAASVEAELRREFKARAEKAEAELAKHQWRTIVDAATDDFDAPEDIDLLLGWFDGPAWRIEIGTAWSSYDGWQTTATHWQPLPSPPGRE